MLQQFLSFTSNNDTGALLVKDAARMCRAAEPQEVRAAAVRVLAGQLRGTEVLLDSPAVVRNHLRPKFGTLEHEVFAAIHLDAQHR